MYVIRLYVAGGTPSSAKAAGDLTNMLERRLGTEHSLEIVDVIEDPDQARRNNVLATPTAQRVHPGPTKRIVGDMNCEKKVMLALGLPGG